MRLLLILALAACGANESSPNEDVEADVATGGESADEEVGNEERYLAATTRIFEACYDDLSYLDELHRARRELRIRLLREDEVDNALPAGLVVERVGAGAGQTDELDETATAAERYSADEQQLIALEAELDAFRAEHPDPETWSAEEMERLEELADRLVEHCAARRPR